MQEPPLTRDELAVLTRLGDAYRAYAALPHSHLVDHDEVAFHLHAIGRVVLACAGRRTRADDGGAAPVPGPGSWFAQR